MRCGKAMVGQTLKQHYRYYRCRRAFAGPRHDRCPTLYVNAEALEEAVKAQAVEVLADPRLILSEANRLASQGPTAANEGAAKSQRERLENQKRRMLRLYQMGEIDDDYLQTESLTLRGKMTELQDLLAKAPPLMPVPDESQLREVATAVGQWVRDAKEVSSKSV